MYFSGLRLRAHEDLCLRLFLWRTLDCHCFADCILPRPARPSFSFVLVPRLPYTGQLLPSAPPVLLRLVYSAF